MARRKAGVIDADFTVIDGPEGYGAFAAPPAVAEVPLLGEAQKALLRAKMTAVINALEAARQKAYSVAYYWPTVNWLTMIASATIPGVAGVVATFATPAEVKNSVLSVLNSTMRQQVEIGRANIEEVLAGKIAFSKWLEARRYTAEAIAEILRSLREDTFAVNLTKTLDEVWNDVANVIQWVAGKARELPSKLPSASVIIYAALALGALILYQYATAPLRVLSPRQVAGYIGGGRWPRRTRTRRRIR